jgi:hypothetical protein
MAIVDTIIQFMAAAGPIALAIMGVAVSLRPPPPSGKAHLVWAGAFAAIGIISFLAIFNEIRSTDETLAELRKNTERGPRFEFAGIKSSVSPDGTKYTDINFSNTSDLDIFSFNSQIQIFSLSSEPDKNSLQKMKKDVSAKQLLRDKSSVYISRGMGFSVKAPYIWDIFDTNTRNGLNTYIVALLIYVDKDTDQNHYWVTEYCAKILSKDEMNNQTNFAPCGKFNRHYYSDLELKESD